jgi:hypothetical protein
MSTHSVAEAKKPALEAVVELKPVRPPPRPMTPADLDWLDARKIPRLSRDEDAATLVRQMRDEE